MDNPCSSWLVDSSWDNITELDKLPNFHGIMASFEQYPRDWHLWFTSAEPERATLPGLHVLVKALCYWIKSLPARNNEVFYWDDGCVGVEKGSLFVMFSSDTLSLLAEVWH